MRAWLLDEFNGVPNLRLGEVPDPRPAAGEAALRIHFAALNPADAFLASAQYPARPKLPHILGRDGVGEVVAIGPGVTNVAVGDIAGILRCDAGVESWGTLAETTVVPAASLMKIPKDWSEEQMAAAPLVFLTAWQALTQWSDPPEPPPSGSVLLVTGASGGVGVASVLLGKSMGLFVVALSRSAEKAARLKELGADAVFDPGAADVRKQISTAIAPRKIDIAVDSVAGPFFPQIIALLGYGGRISVVGRSGGPVPEFNTATLFFRRNRIGGVTVSDYKPEDACETFRHIVARLDAIGKRPVIDSVHPFTAVKAAFDRLDKGPFGKVLIRVANP